MRTRLHFAAWLMGLTGLASTAGFAAPGDTLFYNNLNGNLNDFTVVANGGDANIGNKAANQGRSLELRWGPVAVYTDPIVAAVPGAELSLWIRRGADSFSENPEAGEDLVIEYRDAANNWVEIDHYDGNGTPGQTYTPTYALPAAALHANLSIRVRLTAGSGSDYDYWHIDDIRVTETGAVGNPILFSFDESSWTGAPGEILDSGTLGLTGTAAGGAVNSDTDPALAGNPGTCRYGEFDGVDDYVEVADNSALDITDSLTVSAWINMRSYPGGLHTIVSKDTNYEFHINSSGQVYWWWNDSSGTTRSITTAASIGLNQWYHVAIVYASGSQAIYVNGNAWATASYTGSLAQNNLPFYVGTDWNFISRAFDGYIDEVGVDARAYSQAEVQALRDATHPCPAAAAEFSINHDGFGINCLPETITVNVIDSIAGTPLTSYNADVVLDTQTMSGSWSLVSGGGTLTDAVAGDGIAVYSWPLNESQAVFALSYPEGDPTIGNLEVVQQSDPGIRDDNSDGPLVFSPNGFTLTATQLSNPPPVTIPTFSQTQTAGQTFSLHIAAYGQTPNDPVCGVIEAYDGVKNLQFWSGYLNPSSGSRAVEVDTGIAAGPIAGSEAGAGIQQATFTAGQAAVLIKYKDVGSIQIAVKDDTVNAELPQGIRGATAGFVSLPADFAVSNIFDASGVTGNPGALDYNGQLFIAAGAPFQATVTALDAEGDATPNFGRESIPESVRFESVLIAPDPLTSTNPPVSAATGFGAFSGGSATGYDFAWPEVGIIRLRPHIDDNDYLGAGDVVGADSGNVGRFVPDHFAVTANAPFLQTQCVAGSFTYAGQSFAYAIAPMLTATARTAGNGSIQNYSGNFFKLTTTSLQNRLYTSASGLLDTSGVPPTTTDPVVTETAPGQATIVFSSGSGLEFDRTSMPAPFIADIGLSIDVIDEDGVAGLGNPATFGGAGGIAFTDGAQVRYGRLRFTNAVGSELVNLPVPLTSEYFAGPGIGFVTNTADSCTTNVALTLTGFTENLAAGETCVLDSGSPGSSGAGCPAPAPLVQQFIEPPLSGNFNLTLAAPGSGNTGSVTIDSTVPPWLQFDWNAASPGDENPSGQATFGLYGGEKSQIYQRELYY